MESAVSTGFMFLDLFASQINWVMVSIIFTRDIIITILRIIMDMIGISMVTSKLGKLKTFLQMSVIFYMLIILYMSMEEIALYQFFINSNSIYYLMFTTSLVTAYTGLHYLYFNRHVIISRVNK